MSERTLDKLIATLKSEAIEAADKEAHQIVGNAEQRAQKIMKEAEIKKDTMLSNAKIEAKATLDKGEAALKQAARDLTVSVRNDLLKLLKATLEREVKANFTPSLVEKAIVSVVENVGTGVALQLPKDMETKLAEKIQQRLQESHNLESITSDARLLHGFSVTKIDQGWSYHITPEEVAALLNTQLSPKWVEILKNESEA